MKNCCLCFKPMGTYFFVAFGASFETNEQIDYKGYRYYICKDCFTALFKVKQKEELCRANSK